MAFPIDSLTLHFPSAQESAFQHHYQERYTAQGRLALLIGGLLFLAFGLLDWYVTPPDIPSPGSWPYVVITGLLFAVWAISRFALSPRQWQWMMSVGVLIAGIGILVLAFVYAAFPRVPFYSYVGVILVGMAATVMVRLRWLYSISCWAVLLVLYLILYAAVVNLESELLIINTVYLSAAAVIGLTAGYLLERAARQQYADGLALAAEHAKAEQLLLNILPAPIAARLKETPEAIAESFGAVTVLFADVVGFTQMAAVLSPERLVTLLNSLFSAFDALAEQHGLEKIKTIGDAYMAVAGLPEPRTDHADTAARMALGMQAAVATFNLEYQTSLEIRIGLNSGPVVAGVIGTRKFIYDLWGDTVNVASRMESSSIPGAIQVTTATAALLGPGFAVRDRGTIAVKGRGELDTFWLDGLRDQAARDAVPAGDSSISR